MSDELFISTKLPPPLPKEESESYFQKYKQGDQKAREKLIIHNIRLVLSQVYKKFYDTPWDRQELVAVGLIGLIKSVDTFDIERNATFASYAIRCINNEILMFIRKQVKHSDELSMESPKKVSRNGEEMKLEDILEDFTSHFEMDYEEEEIVKEIKKIIRNFPDRDRKILMLYLGLYDDKTHIQKEIADMFHISRERVSTIIAKNIKKIRDQLRKDGIIEEIEENEKRSESKMGKKIKNIYEYLSPYSKEQIDNMLLQLSERDRQIVTLRYGEDLENPVTSEKFGEAERTTFYSNIVPKMRNLLSWQMAVDEKTKEEEKITAEVTTSVVNQDTKKLVKEDEINLLEIFKTPRFETLMNTLSPKEIVIISLKLGYVDGKYFSTTSIAQFLGIEQDEVIKITKKVLLKYRENMLTLIDNAIDVATDNTLTLKKITHNEIEL